MRELLCVVFVVLNYISCIHAKTVYDCNFDDATSANNCFTSTINVAANIGNPNAVVPNGPLSDVTSSLKPTDSGEACKLPYKVGSFSWQMYFCNRGYCPTENNSNSTCKPGKFSSVSLNDNIKKSFQLKTESGGIDSLDQQCLIYYYYMSSMLGTKIITVTKEETSGTKEIIDSVTSSPFNGWIQRKILFKAETRGYKLYFEAQRTSGFQVPTVGFDEISIREGSCDDQHITSDPTAVTSVPIQITTTTIPAETSTVTTTTTTTTHEPVDTSVTTTSTTTTATTPETAETAVTVTTATTTTYEPVETSTTTTTTPEPAETSTTTTTTPEPVETSVTSISTTTTSTTPTTPEPAETTIAAITATTTTYEQVETSTSTTTTTTTTSESVETTTELVQTTSTTQLTSTTTTTTMTSMIEILTAQSASSTTTTISLTSYKTTSLSAASISMETTSTITIPFTQPITTSPIIPITSKSTITTTAMSQTTTVEIVENVVIDSYKKILPREKSHIIVMAVLIPIVWIGFIVALLWMKRSSGVINGILHPFTNWSHSGESNEGSYELSSVSNA
ncbi:unnamed protein product [Rotaria socialis]|uniref:MAM domain-containing protein n=1 Tax=Rotaria socialis TaxID=392032 RepID=A0A821T0D2_9BILA|nr:unnamed protein product [Rotaria socialis]CAF4867409.1 unnamed protein product [Rotaria socialis]